MRLRAGDARKPACGTGRRVIVRNRVEAGRGCLTRAESGGQGSCRQCSKRGSESLSDSIETRPAPGLRQALPICNAPNRLIPVRGCSSPAELRQNRPVRRRHRRLGDRGSECRLAPPPPVVITRNTNTPIVSGTKPPSKNLSELASRKAAFAAVKTPHTAAIRRFPQPQCVNSDEPDQQDRPEHAADAGGALELHREQRRQQAHGDRNEEGLIHPCPQYSGAPLAPSRKFGRPTLVRAWRPSLKAHSSIPGEMPCRRRSTVRTE